MLFQEILARKTIFKTIIRNYFKLLLTDIENSEAATGSVLLKKVFWKNLAKFRKTLASVSLLCVACNFVKKENLAQVFSCEFCKIFETIVLTEQLRENVSKNLNFQTQLCILCFFWNFWYFQCVHHKINNILNYCLQSEMG